MYKKIVDAKFEQFKKNNGFINSKDDTLFEIFVNQLFYRKYRSSDFKLIEDKIDIASVGGGNDCGIDGIFIKINDVFVFTKNEIDSIINSGAKISIEYVFIQSKNKENIETRDLLAFYSGVKNFFRDEQTEKVNDKISWWLDIKNYLMDGNLLAKYNQTPIISTYFCYLGKNLDDSHILSKNEEFKKDISNLEVCGKISCKILDAQKISEICHEVDNLFEKTISYSDYFEFIKSDAVDASGILFLSAHDLLELLVDQKTGEVRRELFSDNVRDYQGDTIVNKEIYETIKNDPTKFCLLNNGITVICDSLISNNRKITLRNPQIVNGCQTCSTIYKASRDGVNLQDVYATLKVIATGEIDVVNSIVKGTNRQNVVYNESFETTRIFHKDFEHYVDAMQQNVPLDLKVYYERRSKQYEKIDDINFRQVFGLKILTQSYISTFMLAPHQGFEHEIDLLEKFDGKIFVDGENFITYYTSAKSLLRLDQLFANHFDEYRIYGSSKYHLLCLIFHLISGRIPNFENDRNVNEYCSKILGVLDNNDEFKKIVDEAIKTYSTIREKWIKAKGQKYIHAIKDNGIFTNFMLESINFKYEKLSKKSPNDYAYVGLVTAVKTDRNGLKFCYIEAEPNDIFVHEDDSPNTDFSHIKGKYVKYKIISLGKYSNKPKGKIINVLPKKKFGN